MSVTSNKQLWPDMPESEKYSQALKEATNLSEMVVIVLQVGLMIASGSFGMSIAINFTQLNSE